MKNRQLTVTANLALAALTLLPLQSRAADSPDPKQTLLNLTDAFKAKDTKAIRNIFYIDAAHKDATDILLASLDASLHYQKAMEAKFGQAGIDAVQGSNGPAAMLEQRAKAIDSATVTIKGDTATLQMDDDVAAKSPTQGKVAFRKIDGQWKVDAASMLGLDNPRVKSFLPLMQKLADATESTAKEVDSEKIQTIQQAQQSLVQKTIAILKEASEASTQPAPATQPAK